MSLKIKVRYWSPVEKVMLDSGCIMQTAFNTLSVHQASQLQGPYEPLIYRVMCEYVGVTMLWTRLYDKHGGPIYEGDLVKAWSQGVCVIGHIKWANGGFFIQAPGAKIWNLFGGGKDHDQETCEVIGNRYQNPDLVPESLKGMLD